MTGRLAAIVFRLLLRLYPPRFRSTYGADMERLFAEHFAEATERRTVFLVRTLSNVAVSGIAERWVALRRNRRRRSSHVSIKGGLMSGLYQDARYALRLLRNQPAFSLFIVLTLAVGIGANSAVFSVVNGVLLKPLPHYQSDKLVAVWGRFDPESGFDFPQFPLSNPEYIEYRDHTRALSDIAAYRTASVTVTNAGAEPERVPAALVSANLFPLLGATPVLGRTFTADEDRPKGRSVVVLSHGYWQSRFAGDPRAVGSTIRVNGEPTTIVGVMSERFAYPLNTTRVWMPLGIDPANPGNRKGHGIRAIGRLASGADLTTARAELQALMNSWKARLPDVHTGHYLFIRPLIEDVAGSVKPALILLLASTGFVLLIVCANIASVVMARGETRGREMAIRGALGAERSRLIRLSLVESAVLACAGGILGLALGYAGVRALLALDPSSMPRSSEVGMDARIVLFAAATSLASAVLFGLIPALRAARPDLQTALRESSGSATPGAHRLWFRAALVAGEVSLTVLLVIGAGLMLRSFSRLLAVEPGFRPDGLITASLSPPPQDYDVADRVETFYASLIARLRSLPGVSAASAGTTVPMWNDQGVWDFEIDGRPTPGSGEVAWNAAAVIVRPGYFETLGVPLVRGRFFNDGDNDRSMAVAVINEAMAAKFFPGEDPLGRRIRIAGVTTPESWMTIVGVSGNVRTESLDRPARPAYHFPQVQTPKFGQGTFRTMSIIVRTAEPERTIGLLRSVVRELDPSIALYDVQTADAIIDQSVARPRFTTVLLGVFAGVGLMLGISGIYGVLAYTVARRTQEIGIRRALGAASGRVVRDVALVGVRPVVGGLVVGIAASYWTTQFWSAQLFGVSPLDPMVYAAVSAGVLIVSAAAAFVPARRALRVSPLVALRSE